MSPGGKETENPRENPIIHNPGGKQTGNTLGIRSLNNMSGKSIAFPLIISVCIT